MNTKIPAYYFFHLNQFVPKSVLILATAPTPVQDLALVITELHEFT